MALSLTLYSFSKRRNSLKVPTGGDTYSVTLKEGSSMLAPTFLLSAVSLDYNYCQFEGKYYWITELRNVRNNLWEIASTMDVLASYRSSILSTSAFVEFSSSSYNTYIADPRTVMRNQNTSSVSVSGSGLVTEGGTYVVGTIGTDTGTYGATNYYCLTQDAVSELCASLLGNEAALTELKEYLASAFDCLISCMYLPLPLNTSGTTVKLGKYDTGISAGKLVQDVVVNTSSISPNWLGDFRDGAPYTQMVLYLPCCGAVNIEPSSFFRGDIMIQQAIDTHTGDICYSLDKPGGGGHIATYAGNCGVSIPVSQYQMNTGKVISGAMSTAGNLAKTVMAGVGSIGSAIAGAFTGGALLGNVNTGFGNGVVDTVMSGAQTYMDSITLTPSMVGSFTSAAGQKIGTQYILTTYHAMLSEGITAKAAVAGLPCYQTTQLSNLSGYCKCSGASVSANAPSGVIDLINAFMNGGIYIE